MGTLHNVRFLGHTEREQAVRLARRHGLSLSNFLRQALGLGPLAHGGLREKAGRRYCGECLTEGRRREVWREAGVNNLCRECWQAAADGSESRA